MPTSLGNIGLKALNKVYNIVSKMIHHDDVGLIPGGHQKMYQCNFPH